MMRRRSITLTTVTAATANGVSTSQTPGAAGNLTITGSLASGGVATFDNPRRLLLTTAADESAVTFTAYGTDRYGNSVSEAMVGPSSATTKEWTRDWATITRIAVSAATSGAVTVGTSGRLSSQWIPLDHYSWQPLGIGVVQSGTANWDIEWTYQELQAQGINGVQGEASVTAFDDATLVNKSASANGVSTLVASGVRLTINSFTAGAVVTANFVPGKI